MHSTYKRAPLEYSDSIRILELEQCTPPKTQLCGHLIPVRLGDSPVFLAVSYAWGRGPESETILIEGFPLHVTKTLSSALTELSSGSTKVSAWADQICVNQCDLSERESQVCLCLMDRMFSQAHQVIAWLGDATQESSSGIRLMQYIGDVLGDGLTRGGVRASGPLYRTPELSEIVPLEDVKDLPDFMGRMLDFSNSGWRTAMLLAQNPLFGRLWVVQEILSAKDLEFRWGGHRIHGNSFFAAVRVIECFLTHPVRSPTIFNVFEKAQRLASLEVRLSADPNFSYLDLLHELSKWECTDNRDRINALAGIVRHSTASLAPWFNPSYTSSVEDLYKAFATGYINNTRSLDILHFAGGQAEYQPNGTMKLPSWTPDWRSTCRPSPLRNASISGTTDRSAPESRGGSFSFDGSEQTLSIRAFLVDEIVYAGPPLGVDWCSATLNPDVVFEKWLQIARVILVSSTDVDSRLALTLAMCEIHLPCQHYPKGPTAAECLAGFAAWAPRLHTSSTFLSTEDLEGDENNPSRPELDLAANYGLRVMKLCQSRSFFVTKNGKLGLGPAQSAAGMPIYSIAGLRTPFMLEEAHHAREFVLRGECYVEGLMNHNADLHYEHLKLI